MEGGGSRGHHGPDGLPARPDRLPERGVHVGDRLLVGLRPAAGVSEDPPVVLLRGVGVVESLAEGAGRLLVAPVADERRPAELRTRPAHVVLAHLEALLLVLERGLLPVGGPKDLRARLEVFADVVGASVALVAPDHPVLDLVCDRGFGAVEHTGHFREREPAVETVGDSFPCVQCHVLCHGSFPFVVVPCTGPDHPALREGSA